MEHASDFAPVHSALESHQIMEIYMGGMPLGELASGSTLTPLVEQPMDALNEHLEIVKDETKSMVEGLASTIGNTMMVDYVLGESKAEMGESPMLPSDTSPTAFLPSGNADNIVSTLEREAWVAGGSPTNETIANHEWQRDSFGAFNPVIDQPVYCDGTALPVLPAFPLDTAGFTVSFWVRHLSLDENLDLTLEMKSDDASRSFTARISHDFFSVEMLDSNASPPLDQMQAEYISFLEDGKLNEKYSIGEQQLTCHGAME